jgi:REP element-mobilizing transposase RayT
MKAARQQELHFRSHGGRRRGAGRPRGNRVSHDERPRFARPTPVHIVLRARDTVWNLRSGRSYRRIRRAFEKARGRFGVRLIHFSIQGNHLHLIVEADGNEALSRAMQGLCIRIAKVLNAMMERSGSVFDDHYFARLLRTPTELVRAIAYVLGNHTHHFGQIGLDPFSSSALGIEGRERFLAVPVGWLLRVGWKHARH